MSQVLSGNLVDCSGVRVVAVNWKRQAPLEHWYRPGRYVLKLRHKLLEIGGWQGE